MEELLAIKLRPEKLDDIIGQQHLVGKGKVLRNLVNNKKLFSCILYGKPGIGKTSIAMAIVKELNLEYRLFNAVINNKKDLDIIIEEAKMYKGLILVVDEIHRLNKDKQDILLPHLESGLITLIGMTTSNPYHSINPAIRSRCQIYELYELTDKDMEIAIKRAVKSGILENLSIEKDAIKYIINASGYDLRYIYNLIEVAYYSSSDGKITVELLKNMNMRNNVFIDKNEDGYYDTISAFQKSIRGSDVNASLHYLAELIEAEDLEIICRRLSVIVYEDIGLANPSMGPKVMAAIQAVERLGLPEAKIPLADVVIELALSPKSNSGVMAVESALSDVRRGNTGNVPKHLKTNSKDYIYPHDYPNDYVRQQYLPTKIKNAVYYNPKNNKYERNLKDIMDKLSKL